MQQQQQEHLCSDMETSTSQKFGRFLSKGNIAAFPFSLKQASALLTCTRIHSCLAQLRAERTGSYLALGCTKPSPPSHDDGGSLRRALWRIQQVCLLALLRFAAASRLVSKFCCGCCLPLQTVTGPCSVPSSNTSVPATDGDAFRGHLPTTQEGSALF